MLDKIQIEKGDIFKYVEMKDEYSKSTNVRRRHQNGNV
ncbi:hypothetical protein JMA_03730 [Jeotgalibacillus malaysiensis]|uniref:Uncharacterized protein n=1 Tax=Jeotgalibacillus malaysiensis TaxID=1508404 RepID=A0A0B5AH32_9BACL|nr:hypothetical protein JMA_03730 [Jeotgalibacillus malaysiensis]